MNQLQLFGNSLLKKKKQFGQFIHIFKCHMHMKDPNLPSYTYMHTNLHATQFHVIYRGVKHSVDYSYARSEESGRN